MIENRPENQPKSEDFKLIDDPREILQEWTSEINQAGEGEKVWLRTMLCRQGKVMNALEPSLVLAANRGADVRIILDPISFYLSDGNIPSLLRFTPFPGSAEIAEDFQDNTRLIERLRGSISVEFSRPESLVREAFPYKGADHIKGTRIRDKFYFGDKNLEDESFLEMHGFVVRIQNPELVESLTEIISSTQSPSKDQVTNLKSDPNTQILWDAGIPNESVILETALRILSEESTFIGTSTQFIPDGRFLEALELALHRGVEIQPITSKSEVFMPAIPYWAINRVNAKRMLRGRSPIRVAFAPPRGVHAKYLVTSQGVEFGSNNHSHWGIKAGTAELAISSSNPSLVQQVRDYHDRLFDASRSSA